MESWRPQTLPEYLMIHGFVLICQPVMYYIYNSPHSSTLVMQSTKHFRVGPKPSLSAWSCLTSATWHIVWIEPISHATLCLSNCQEYDHHSLTQSSAQLWLYLQPGLDGYSLRSLAGILLKMVWKSAQPVRLCWGQNSCYFMVICKYLLPPTKYGAVSGWTSWWWLPNKFKTSDLTRSLEL